LPITGIDEAMTNPVGLLKGVFFMPTIEKTIKIPENSRVHLEMELDLPKELALSDAKLCITISPVPTLSDDMPLSAFYGCLKDEDVFIEDSVEIQRKMRDEW
jgi:hypothetical protein